MRPYIGARERGWLAGLAFSGLIAAHGLSYLVAEPHHEERVRLLAHTGHGSWTGAFFFAGALAVAALLFLGARFARPNGALSSNSIFRAAAPRLALVQLVGFTVLESGERLLEHGDPHTLLHEPVFLIGLALQVLVAAAGACLISLSARIVSTLAARLIRPAEPETSLPRLVSVVRAPRGVESRAYNLRGPPPVLLHG